MREFSTPLTTEIPATGNLTDDVVTNARDAADTVQFSRPAAGGGAKKYPAESTSSKSRLYSSGRYDAAGRRYTTEFEEKQSGFDDMMTERTRPNYVINTISKSTSSICDINHQIGTF